MPTEYPDPFENLCEQGRGYKWPLGVWMHRRVGNDPRDQAWGIKLSPWLRIDIMLFPNRITDPNELVAVISANSAKGVRIEGVEGEFEAKRLALELASKASLHAIEVAAQLDDDLLKEKRLRSSHPLKKMQKRIDRAKRKVTPA